MDGLFCVSYDPNLIKSRFNWPLWPLLEETARSQPSAKSGKGQCAASWQCDQISFGQLTFAPVLYIYRDLRVFTVRNQLLSNRSIWREKKCKLVVMGGRWLAGHWTIEHTSCRRYYRQWLGHKSKSWTPKICPAGTWVVPPFHPLLLVQCTLSVSDDPSILHRCVIGR